MARNQAGKKLENQLLRSKAPVRGITKLMPRTGALLRFKSRFPIFWLLESSLHLQLCYAERCVLSDNYSLKHTLPLRVSGAYLVPC